MSVNMAFANQDYAVRNRFKIIQNTFGIPLLSHWCIFYKNLSEAKGVNLLLICLLLLEYLYRQHRDLSLLNLGCIVQQARCPAEAAIVLHAAVDHAPHMAASHFVLANVYAILGDYNRYLTVLVDYFRHSFIKWNLKLSW